MRLLAAVLAAMCVTTVGADAAEPGFTYGVAAGEVTATSAILWTRAPAAGPVRLEVAGRARLLDAAPGNDLTVQARVRGLRPATAYRYRFVQRGRASAVGRFRTAPSASADARVRFAVTGDADATPAGTGRPTYDFAIYARLSAARRSPRRPSTSVRSIARRSPSPSSARSAALPRCTRTGATTSS